MSGNTVEVITTALKETEDGPIELISKIVGILGEETSRELLEETERIEAAGGELVRRGTRRRTPGGVFFRLARQRLSEDQRRDLFGRPAQPRPPNDSAPKQQAQPAEPARPQPPPQRYPVQPAYRAKPQQNQSPPVFIRKRRVVDVTGAPSGPVTRTAPAGVVASHDARAPSAMAASGSAHRPESEPRAAVAAPQRAPLAQPQPQRRSDRVRIIQLAPQPKEPPATTPEEIRARAEELLGKLEPKAAQGIAFELVLSAFRRTAGDDAAVRDNLQAAVDRKLPKEEPIPELQEEAVDEDPHAVAPELRERLLAAVTDALELSSADYARVLLGDESPAAKRKATTLLKRHRES